MDSTWMKKCEPKDQWIYNGHSSDGPPSIVGGIAVWKYPWIDIEEQQAEGKTTKFSAAEFSNCVCASVFSRMCLTLTRIKQRVKRSRSMFWLCLLISLFPNLAMAIEGSHDSHEAVATSNNQGQTQCFNSPDYFVVVQDIEGRVGQNFIIKYKQTPDEDFPCTYLTQANDFEIRGEWAAYFSGMQDNLLYLEHSTGPGPYTFTIWDLTKRQKVFESFGSDVVFNEDSVVFWLETGPAEEENCPESIEWKLHGLGAAIETKAILNLSDFRIVPTDETRCSPRQ